MVVPKSGEVWKVWKECGIIPQKVVELYCGMGNWHRMSGHDRKAIIQQGRTMNPIGFTVRPCYAL